MTFPFLTQGAEEFVELARARAPKIRVIVLKPGDEVDLSSLS